VPVLRAHGRRLVELAAEAEKLDMAYLVIGNGSPRNKNGLVRLADKVNGKADAPGLSTWRLRATWLVTLLSAHMPYDVITTIGGKGTGARLSELLEYVEPLHTATMARMVAGAGEQR
jgi:hypothetical protein